MSFFKEMFKCCQPVNQKHKTEIVVDSNENYRTESSNATGSVVPVIQQSPKEIERSPKMRHSDMPTSNKPLIFSSFDGSAVIAPGIKNRKSIYGQPDYVPVTNVETATLQSSGQKKLEITDVVGNILNNQKIEISLKGLKRHKRLSIISLGESEIEIIKTINYFWIENRNTSQLLINSNKSSV